MAALKQITAKLYCAMWHSWAPQSVAAQLCSSCMLATLLKTCWTSNMHNMLLLRHLVASVFLQGALSALDPGSHSKLFSQQTIILLQTRIKTCLFKDVFLKTGICLLRERLDLCACLPSLRQILFVTELLAISKTEDTSASQDICISIKKGIPTNQYFPKNKKKSYQKHPQCQ